MNKSKKPSGKPDALSGRGHAYLNNRIEHPDWSKIKCAEEAGFAKSTAHVYAYRLENHPLVAAGIEKAQKRLEEEAIISAKEVMELLAGIARSSLGDFVEWGPTGIKLKDSKDLTEEQKSLLAEVGETQHGTKIKLLDKKGALDSLARILGMNKDTLKVSGVKALIGVDIDQI